MYEKLKKKKKGFKNLSLPRTNYFAYFKLRTSTFIDIHMSKIRCMSIKVDVCTRPTPIVEPEWCTAKNYHPVSLLSVVSKVFEKLVYNRIVDQ